MLIRLLLCLFYCTSVYANETALLPTAYKGRIRPLAVYAEEWLYDLTHDETLAKNPFAMELLLSLYVDGTEKWANKPLFKVPNTDLKNILQLDSSKGNFSYQELKRASQYLPTEFSKKRLQDAAREFTNQLAYWEAISQDSSSLLTVVPGRWQGAPWRSLNSIAVLSDASQFPAIASQLLHDYEKLAGTPAQQAQGKTIYYPTILQLRAELIYHSYPWVLICLAAYALALLCAFFPKLRAVAYISLGTGFILHTGLIAARSYILNRPPVSNMFESVLFVPWAAVCLGIALGLFRTSKSILFSSAFLACILLTILHVTHIDASLENVQPVLDSQFWLIIHVLMVVSSYAVFLVAGLLAHLYLILYRKEHSETLALKRIAGHHLQLLYIGTALLIPGTILGGVWAAESWGRFWDWDPKESWAFISSCIYVFFIHAYRFQYIQNFGLAVGSIVGLQAITFTWYGVNYILGTGLHSYGFGKGGEWLYFGFMASEALFVGYICSSLRNLLNQNNKLRYYKD